jgi:hypothetical protein
MRVSRQFLAFSAFSYVTGFRIQKGSYGSYKLTIVTFGQVANQALHCTTMCVFAHPNGLGHSMDGNDLIVSFGEVICAGVGCSARADGPFGLAPRRKCPPQSLLAGVGRDRR